jgi:hypothetical protein
MYPIPGSEQPGQAYAGASMLGIVALALARRFAAVPFSSLALPSRTHQCASRLRKERSGQAANR